MPTGNARTEMRTQDCLRFGNHSRWKQCGEKQLAFGDTPIAPNRCNGPALRLKFRREIQMLIADGVNNRGVEVRREIVWLLR